MDTPNSQKRSPRSSAKNERRKADLGEPPRREPVYDDDDRYFDRNFDLVARVRAAKEAAQRKMEEFGDPSEYDVTYIYGQWKPETAPAGDDPQASLPFKDEAEIKSGGE